MELVELSEIFIDFKMSQKNLQRFLEISSTSFCIVLETFLSRWCVRMNVFDGSAKEQGYSRESCCVPF